VETILLSVTVGWKSQRYPHVHLRRPSETGLHHADDLIGLPVQFDFSADDCGIGSPEALPGRVRQDYHGIRIGDILFRTERSPQVGLSAEDSEPLDRYARALQALRDVAAGVVEIALVHCGGVREDLAAVPDVGEVGS